MSGSTASPPRHLPRHLVFGTALLLAFAVSLAPKSPHAIAQDTKVPGGAPVTIAPAVPPSADTPPVTTNPPAPAPPPAKAAIDIGKHGISINIGDKSGEDQAKTASGADNSPPDPPGTLTIKKNGKTVRVTGLPEDDDLKSLGKAMHGEPPAAMIFAIVAVVFLSPVLAIALILGYRMRKNRMLNETILKLVEKGLVPPAEALQAVSAGRAPSGGPAYAGTMGGLATLAAQAGDMRKRAAWSDLRKGILLGAVGLGFSLYSFFDDREANFLGLVLLFVGIGYLVLWWFEERQLAARERVAGQTRPAVTAPGGEGPGTAGKDSA